MKEKLPFIETSPEELTKGIFVDRNPYNDPRCSPYNGLRMDAPMESIRCYIIKTKRKIRVSFKKPQQTECCSVVTNDKGVVTGVPAHKIENWDKLPDQLPYNEEVLKSSFFDTPLSKMKIIR